MKKSIHSLLLTVSMIVFSPIAKANPPWAPSTYYGTMNLRLQDDPIIAQAMEQERHFEHQVDRIHSQIDQLNQKLAPLEKQSQKLQDQKTKSQQEINKIDESIKGNQQKLQQLQDQITDIDNQKTQLNTQLTNAQATKTQAEQAKNKAQSAYDLIKAQLDSAETERMGAETNYKNALATCLQTGTADVCNAKNEIINLKNILNNKTQARDNIQNVLTSINSDLKIKTDEFQKASAKVTDLQTRISALEAKSQDTKAQIASLKIQNQDLQTSKQAKLSELNQTQQQIDQLNIQLSPLKQQQAQLMGQQSVLERQLREAKIEVKRKTDELIARIQEVNTQAYFGGRTDGTIEGNNIASNLGNYKGGSDGDRDGLIAGEREGRQREYDTGYGSGLVAGKAQAQTDGQRDGTLLGTNQGNASAGKREGIAAGILRAQNSDASNVGARLGQADGATRADKEGQIKGSEIGQQEMILKYENRSLPSISINGPFAGTFDYQVPTYPGSNAGNYNVTPCYSYPRQIVRAACEDGYHFGYFQSAEERFYAVITSVYDNAYKNAYDSAQRRTLSFYYQDSFDQGQKEATTKAYNEWYPQFKEQFRASAFAEFDQTPDRNANEYIASFTPAESDSYKNKYEEIKNASYAQNEQNSFDALFPSRKEQYRAKRAQEVEKLYKNAPVLKFIESNIRDAGINGVAALDGVYQPEETILADLTLTNFSLVPAKNVTLVVDGQSFNLPEVPASSIVTIKGAGRSKVTANINNKQSISMSARTAIGTYESSLQAQHLIDGNALFKDATKEIISNYPLEISSIDTIGDIVVGENTGLKAVISNKSNRAYQGNIKIELESSFGNGIIVQSFSDLTELSSAQMKSDAMVKISNSVDAYKDISFSARIYQNGVLLGKTKAPLASFAKVRFIDNKSSPIVIINSMATDRRFLLDIASELGGIEQLSLMDLSLQENQSTLDKGFEKRNFIVIDTENAQNSLSTRLESLIKNSVNSFFIFADEENTGLSRALQKVTSLSKSRVLPLQFAGLGQVQLVSTNEYALSLKGSSSFAQANSNNLSNLLAVSEYFKLDASSLVERIANVLDETSYFGPSIDLTRLLSILNFRILEDTSKFSVGYEDSASRGFLGFHRYDKSWRTRLEGNEKRLFISTLNSMMKNKNNLAIASYVAERSYEKARNEFETFKNITNSDIRDSGNKATDKTWEEGKQILKAQKPVFLKDLEKSSPQMYFPFQVSR